MKQTRFVSLFTRAQRQLGLVGAGVAALIIGFSWFGWDYVVNAHAQRVEQGLRQHYANQLAFWEDGWQRAARRLRAQIEFMRLGEIEPEARRLRLRAFFTAQGEERDFAGMLVQDAAGIPQFSLGCEALLMGGADALQLAAGEARGVYLPGFCAEEQGVYRLTHVPLWLGSQGMGRMTLAAALDNAWLARLARSGDELYITQGDRIVAASGGSVRLNDRIDPAFTGRVTDLIQIVLPLSPGGGPAPLLVVRAAFDPLLAPVEAALASGLTALALIGLLWLGLGRTMRRHLHRLSLVSGAAARFEGEFRREAGWLQTISAHVRRSDEIDRLAHALDSLMQVAEARQREQVAYQQTLDMLDEVVIELDLQGRLTRVSGAWPRVSGFDAAVLGQSLLEHIHPDDAPALDSLFARLSEEDKAQASARLRLKAPQGEERWLELRLARAPDGEALRGVLRDITQSYLQERRITHMALHDALTGLPNRVLLEDRLKVAIRLAGRNQHRVALGFIDLDHFKHVNDNLGHKAGDALLVALAQRLRASLRAGDTLARWGGDEFVVLLPDLPNAEAAREIAAKLRSEVEQPLRVQETEFNLTFSAGFAVYPDDASDPEILLAHADRAMFYAKAQGRNALQFYADMTRKGLGKKEMYIQQRLVAAVREGRIVNHYQPLIDAQTGRTVGVEVLARWFDPELGAISPSTFIPMAESLGIIHELGERVWHQALTDARDWIAHGLGLSVNISKRQLFKPDFTRHLLADLEAAGLDPSVITLEITESLAVMDVEHSFDRLKELHAAGLRLSIDDFGTGYSSLSQLHDLPVHELKIDIAFVRRIHTAKGRHLVQAMVDMARGLGLETVAEGVEDEPLARMLAAMGIGCLQGWYCGRPMPAAAMRQWIAQHGSGRQA